jgi:hypothetical protein
MKQEFVKKWSIWWRLQNKHEELTDAFEKELNAIIEQEIAKKLKQPPVIKSVCDCGKPIDSRHAPCCSLKCWSEKFE